MKKVYVVIESSGAFDDYIRWINSVWESPEAAEKRKQEIIAWIKQAADKPSPYSQEEIQLGNLSDEQYQLYDDWYEEWYAATNSNEPTIEEHELQ